MLSAIGKLFLKLPGKLFLKVLRGSRNERLIRAHMHVVREQINVAGERLDEEYRDLVRKAAGDYADQLTADEFITRAKDLRLVPWLAKDWLLGKTAEYRRRLRGGQSLDDVMPDAFAAVRVASWLARDHRQFDVQLAAGQILHEGCIAEEATGEGKTIACYPAVYLTILAGKKAHVVTTNDYLVQRDCDFAWPVFHLLGVTVGAIQEPMSPTERQGEYACDLIYGTNSVFGFDYVRDNM